MLNRQMGGFNSNAHLMTSSLLGVTNGVISVDRAASLASTSRRNFEERPRTTASWRECRQTRPRSFCDAKS